MRLVKWLEAAVDLVGRTAAWATFLLVLLVAFDVLMRYLFRAGTVWMQELEWHLLVPIALFGMSYAMRHGEHVRVDFIYDLFSPRGKRVMDLFAAIITVSVSYLLIKFSIPFVEQSWTQNEGSPDPGGLPARYVLKLMIPLGFGMLMIQGMADLIRHSILIFRPDTDEEPGR